MISEFGGLYTLPIILNFFEETLTFKKIDSKTLLWNGPLGFFERDFFANGSNEIAKLIKINWALSI